MTDNAWAALACAGFAVYAIGLWACAHYDYKQRVANIDELFKWRGTGCKRAGK